MSLDLPGETSASAEVQELTQVDVEEVTLGGQLIGAQHPRVVGATVIEDFKQPADYEDELVDLQEILGAKTLLKLLLVARDLHSGPLQLLPVDFGAMQLGQTVQKIMGLVDYDDGAPEIDAQLAAGGLLKQQLIGQ